LASMEDSGEGSSDRHLGSGAAASGSAEDEGPANECADPVRDPATSLVFDQI
jgi:hypothetical protein